MPIATVLVVDDSYDRLRAIAGSMRQLGEVVITAETAEAAMLKLTGVDGIGIKSLFLDHDLGEGSADGTQLARWIAASDRQYDNITIHSMNVPRAQEMEAILAEKACVVQIVPFITLKSILQDTVTAYKNSLHVAGSHIPCQEEEENDDN